MGMQWRSIGEGDEEREKAGGKRDMEKRRRACMGRCWLGVGERKLLE